MSSVPCPPEDGWISVEWNPVWRREHPEQWWHDARKLANATKLIRELMRAATEHPPPP